MALPHSVFDQFNRMTIGDIIELEYTDLEDVLKEEDCDLRRAFMTMFPVQLKKLRVNESKRSSFGQKFRKDRNTRALLSTKPFDSTEEKLTARVSEYVPSKTLLTMYHMPTTITGAVRTLQLDLSWSYKNPRALICAYLGKSLGWSVIRFPSNDCIRLVAMKTTNLRSVLSTLYGLYVVEMHVVKMHVVKIHRFMRSRRTTLD